MGYQISQAGLDLGSTRAMNEKNSAPIHGRATADCED
jgi:hypothetical protein